MRLLLGMLHKPMKRSYSKIVRDGWNDAGEITECLAWITYFLGDGTVGRIDYYNPKKGLFKVSYRQVAPPYDALLKEHWKEYPQVWCEVATPAVLSDDGSWVMRTLLYFPGNVLERQFEVHLDDAGKTVRQIEIARDGQRKGEERPVYNDQGQQIGTRIYNAAGKFLYLDDFEEVW